MTGGLIFKIDWFILAGLVKVISGVTSGKTYMVAFPRSKF
jgi:hypothetical protein